MTRNIIDCEFQRFGKVRVWRFVLLLRGGKSAFFLFILQISDSAITTFIENHKNNNRLYSRDEFLCARDHSTSRIVLQNQTFLWI